MSWRPPTHDEIAAKVARAEARSVRPRVSARPALTGPNNEATLEDIKQAIATLIRVMDLFGDAPWPLFERLVREYEERTEREELRERYREITKEYARP